MQNKKSFIIVGSVFFLSVVVQLSIFNHFTQVERASFEKKLDVINSLISEAVKVRDRAYIEYGLKLMVSTLHIKTATLCKNNEPEVFQGLTGDLEGLCHSSNQYSRIIVGPAGYKLVIKMSPTTLSGGGKQIIVLSFLLNLCILLAFSLYFLSYFRVSRKNLVLRAITDFSTQVAHDIRSPLSTIDMVTEDMSLITGEKVELLKRAAARIHGIADGLLDYKRSPEEVLIQTEIVSLSSAVLQIVEEKKLQFPNNTFDFQNRDIGLRSKINEVEFGRILSNLLNNAIEASSNSDVISIKFEQLDSKATISIMDRGQGISTEVLQKLGERGVSSGKSKGNGLGIFHAKQQITNWGGDLYFLSEIGKGTTITIELPLVLNNKTHIVLLDDDQLLRLTWESKAKTEGIEISTYSKPSELIEALNFLPQCAIYYIDSCLENDEKGEDIALQLYQRGIRNIYLATGYDADKFKSITYIKGVVGKGFPDFSK